MPRFFPDERSIPAMPEVRYFCRAHVGRRSRETALAPVFQQPTVSTWFPPGYPDAFLDDAYGWRAEDALQSAAVRWIVGGRK